MTLTDPLSLAWLDTHRTDCPERVAPVLRWREGIDCERVGGES